MTEKKHFWSSLPGTITAVAGLITAIGGLLVVLHQVGIIGGFPNNQDQSIKSTLQPGIYVKKDLKEGERLLRDRITAVKEYQLKSGKYEDRVQNISEILNSCLAKDISTGTPITWYYIGECD